MTAYVKCVECGDGVPWYYAWIWHPRIAMHPGCAMARWDEEGAGAMGPAIRIAVGKADPAQEGKHCKRCAQKRLKDSEKAREEPRP